MSRLVEYEEEIRNARIEQILGVTALELTPEARIDMLLDLVEAYVEGRIMRQGNITTRSKHLGAVELPKVIVIGDRHGKTMSAVMAQIGMIGAKWEETMVTASELTVESVRDACEKLQRIEYTPPDFPEKLQRMIDDLARTPPRLHEKTILLDSYQSANPNERTNKSRKQRNNPRANQKRGKKGDKF